MRTTLLAVVAAATLLTGCANLLSIHRQRNITPAGADKANPGAEITFVDAKQRAIISVQRQNKTVVCAEPSPDGLQAVASSTAFSVQETETRLAQIANSLSEAATNIGLRTQSIQLLRDAMYRICEGYAGHAIDDDQFVVLHRRYQNLMLGLLAIEQLTGAVTNSQVALYTNANATAGAAASELSAAQGKLKTEQDALADATRLSQVAVGEQKAIDEAIKKKQEVLDKLKPDQTADAEKLRGEIEAHRVDKNKKDAEVAALETKARNQSAMVQNAQIAFNAASAKLTAATGSSGSLIDGLTGKGLTDAETAKAVSQAVVNIVNQVVTTSFNHDACFGILDRLSRETVNVKYLQWFEGLSQACISMLTAQLKTEAANRESMLEQTKRTPTHQSTPPAAGNK